MKKLIFSLLIILLSSCNSNYYECFVRNNTNSKISVEIKTTGGENVKHLYYEINSGEIVRVFVHTDNLDINGNEDEFLKYIQHIEIYNSYDKRKVIKEFTPSNIKTSTKDGLFGHHIKHLFIVNNNDFEK